MEIQCQQISYHRSPPNKDLHRIPCIRNLYDRYIALARAKNPNAVILDPFARNAELTLFTNDIDVNTEAAFHMDAADFLQFMLDSGVKADVIIFDPPFSFTQNKKTYKQGTTKRKFEKTLDRCKQIIPMLLKMDGIIVSSGWTANGVGQWRGLSSIELMVVNHGYHRYATTVLVEKKIFIPRHVKWIDYQNDKDAVDCCNRLYDYANLFGSTKKVKQ